MEAETTERQRGFGVAKTAATSIKGGNGSMVSIQEHH
jgi:hypothetical protein